MLTIGRPVFKQNMNMEYAQRLLLQSNLGLDPTLMAQIKGFLAEHVGDIQCEQRDYAVFAAAAISAEVATLPTLNGLTAKSGVTIESVMRHVGTRSRELFLETLARQAQKWRQAPLWLREKIGQVRFNYRIYKKYRMVFEGISSNHSPLSKEATGQMQALLWVLFIFVKNQNHIFEDPLESSQLLNALFLFAFTELVTQLSPQTVNEFFRVHFPEVPACSAERYSQFRGLMVQKLQEVYEFRYQKQQMSLGGLVRDDNFRMRYLDDIGNQYDRFALGLPQNTVNQISFLKLEKTLTPLSIQRLPESKPISAKLNFMDDSSNESGSEEEDLDIQDPQTPPQQPNPYKRPTPITGVGFGIGPSSPVRNIQVLNTTQTPVAARYMNLEWVNRIVTSKCIQDQTEQVRALFQKYTGLAYEPYQARMRRKLLQAINEFTPSCRDVDKRQRSMEAFFMHFVLQIRDEHNQAELEEIFKQESHFDSILCLATNIINYAYNSLHSSYKQYCQIFGVSLYEGQKTINWFGLNKSMPKNIPAYLYDLQRKILVQEIWEDDTGYQLIKREGESSYAQLAFLKRLRLHVDERTQELCESMKIVQGEVMRIINLVRHVVERKQELLARHKVDQIVVCAIAGVLSINQSRSNYSLDEIFRHYNNLMHSFNSNRHMLFDSEGNRIDIIDYYNTVFLPSIDSILSSQEHAAQILNTPIRIKRKQSLEQGVPIVPMQLQFSQGHPTKKVKTDQNRYRASMVRSFQSLGENMEEENEEQDSPHFGGAPEKPPETIFRHFSFGDRIG